MVTTYVRGDSVCVWFADVYRNKEAYIVCTHTIHISFVYKSDN